jgi:hypothetical protein
VSDGESRSDTPTNIELPIPDDAPVTVFTDGGSAASLTAAAARPRRMKKNSRNRPWWLSR